jgi:hypothetical protein
MNIDLHSHFFPVEALQNPGKYEDRAPKIVLVDKGKLSVTSQIGFRPGLGAAAYHPAARIKALDEMKIDLQAISPSPILLFYWGGRGCRRALFAPAERGDSSRRAETSGSLCWFRQRAAAERA